MHVNQCFYTFNITHIHSRRGIQQSKSTVFDHDRLGVQLNNNWCLFLELRHPFQTQPLVFTASFTWMSLSNTVMFTAYQITTTVSLKGIFYFNN